MLDPSEHSSPESALLPPEVIRNQAAFLRQELPRKYHHFFDLLCRTALASIALASLPKESAALTRLLAVVRKCVERYKSIHEIAGGRLAAHAIELIESLDDYEDRASNSSAPHPEPDDSFGIVGYPRSAPHPETVRVPREPTVKMVIAGQMAIPPLPYYADNKQRTGNQDQPWCYAAACYKAMLAAAHDGKDQEGR